MDKEPIFSTKSIPNFIILLPVLSIVSITLFVLILINGIKEDLLKNEMKENSIRHENMLKQNLKDNSDQFLVHLNTLLKSASSNKMPLVNDNKSLQKLLAEHQSKHYNYSIYAVDKTKQLIPLQTTPSLPDSLLISEKLMQSSFIEKIIQAQAEGLFEATLVNDQDSLVYFRFWEPMQWLVTVYTLKKAYFFEEERSHIQRETYFKERTTEILIAILIVSVIILLIALIVARIISNIFKKFRDKIQEQNRSLKKLNIRLNKRVEQKSQALKQSEERYKTIFESYPDGVLTLENGRIIYCNDSLLQMFRFSSKKILLEKPLSLLFSAPQPYGLSSKELLNKNIDYTYQFGYSNFELFMEKSDKQSFYVEIWLQEIEVAGTKSIYMIFRDIDFQKRAQKQIDEQHKELLLLNENLEKRVGSEVQKNQEKEKYLIQQSRLAQMGEMISMIAHQWRQPLAAISASSANIKLLMELDQYSKERFDHSLSQIEGYVLHLSRTIDDFRNFFKPDKSKERFSVNDLIQRTLSIIQQSLQEDEITVSLSMESSIFIHTYAHELMQVMLNILKNAQDAFLEGHTELKEIKISYTLLEDAHQIRFDDNAGGIPAEILEDIFDPYFSTKSEKNGTGIGLYMSKVIIAEHCKGEIRAENSDVGATFIIELPLD